MAEESWHSLHNDIDDSRAHAGQEVIAQEAISSPHELKFAAEHPEHEHVREDVPDGGNVVKKEIGERLPEVEMRDDSGRHKTEPLDKSIVGGLAPKVIEESFKYKNGEIRDHEQLHTRGDVKVEADSIALDARP